MDRILEKGAAGGLESLAGMERMVWLIAEAEVICDLEGIDSFREQYGMHLEETARAFARVGASDIASALGQEQWARANELIRARAGYNDESVRRIL